MKIFYYNGKIGQSVKIDDEQFGHITRVLRMQVGDKFLLFNGDGNFYECQISAISKRDLIANVLDCQKSENQLKNQITVFQGIVKKPDNQTLIIQKLCELGVQNLVFFESEYTNTKLDGSPKSRFEKIVIESCKQCKRANLICVSNQPNFKNVLEQLKTFDLVIFAYENSKTGDLSDFLTKCSGKNIALVVGSEGGFSQSEVELLQNANAKTVSLGKTILRAETACIALASAALCLLGEWQ